MKRNTWTTKYGSRSVYVAITVEKKGMKEKEKEDRTQSANAIEMNISRYDNCISIWAQRFDSIHISTNEC